MKRTELDDNSHISIGYLISMERKIKFNQEIIDDYEYLDDCLSRVGLPNNYLLKCINQLGIYGFEELYLFRKSPPTNPTNPIKEGMIHGTMTGLISFLKGKLESWRIN